MRTRAAASAKALGIATAFVFAQPMPAAPESLTLTTYYPAPYGVYQEMRATRSVSFAFEAPSYKVGIGTTQPGSKLSVRGAVAVGDGYETTDQSANPDGLIVKGRVGIGTPYPSPGDSLTFTPPYALDVVGGARFTKNIYVNQQGNCRQQATPPGSGSVGSLAEIRTSCNAGEYATWTPGFYSKGRTDVGMPSAYNDLAWSWEVQMGANVVFMCCKRLD